jgi:CTP synthase (UTP-ammonia lyase)
MACSTASLCVGVIGDYEPDRLSHAATNAALDHAAKTLSVTLDRVWLPTPSLEGAPEAILGRFDALWCSPGSPYKSMCGALNAIQYARERGVPFIGT